ncbi:tyrosine-type recombinase/integrase [Agromyces mediolanus]|uniref:Phage integrase n=1 Tax=Agromyces mediolanus TaxID=41986 RepID=A0A918CLE5_AGRME|nr:tyrosine-type recombinase/integrase [Agromyces mediolanus]GGR28849.1 phage integrase [Agromyces mediolanus]GLJ72135.1 phage integrase [Agromyces mediolanus]
MANVREVARKDGVAYEVRWRDANGKFKQKTFTARREADRFSLRVENELADGGGTEALVKNAKKFRDVAEAMMAATHKLKPKTRRGYEDCFALHIYPTFGNRRINTITSMDVEKWAAEMRTKPKPKHNDDAPDLPYAASTVRGALIALSKVFKYAARHRLISGNPCAGIEKPKIVREEPTFLSPQQVERLADWLDDVPPYGLIVRFAAYTGLRPGELEALRIRDINFLRRHVEVRRQAQHTPKVGLEYITPKSAKAVRDVPLTRSLLRALAQHVEAHPYRSDPDALLWPGRKKGGAPGKRAPLSYDVPFRHGSVYRGHLKPALEELGIPVVRWYDLRHFYASACAAQGIDIHKVARWMGHANINMTYSTYMHLFVDGHEADMERLDALGGAATPVEPLARIGNGWPL